MQIIVLHALSTLVYAGMAVHLWNSRWHAGAPAALCISEQVVLLAGLVLHSLALWQTMFNATPLYFGFGHALSATLWITVAVYWVQGFFMRVEGILPLVLVLAALCAPLPGLFPGLAMPGYTQSLEFRLHLVMAMLAYGLFMIAALHALLMTLVERRLHGGAAAERSLIAGPLANLPPLLSLEALLFRIITLGFALLTLTLLSGVVFSETVFGQAIRFNHKTVFACLSWLIFGSLIAGRHFYGWRGRKALRWTLSGFVSLLLAYVGSRFVLEVLLHRTAG